MTYDPLTHGSTEGKVRSRKIVEQAIYDFATSKRFKHLRGLSLPSCLGVFEESVFNRLKYITPFVKKQSIYCIEREEDIYNEMQGKLPKICSLHHEDFKDTTEKLDWFWYDSCGTAVSHRGFEGSNLQLFVEKIKELLDQDRGLAFLTVSVLPNRVMKAKEAFDHLSELIGEKSSLHPDYNDLVLLYSRVIENQLGKEYKCIISYIYEGVTTPFCLIGVEKNEKKRFRKPKFYTDCDNYANWSDINERVTKALELSEVNLSLNMDGLSKRSKDSLFYKRDVLIERLEKHIEDLKGLRIQKPRKSVKRSPKKKRKKKDKVNIGQAFYLYSMGIPIRWLAEYYGVSRYTVKYRLKNNGLWKKAPHVVRFGLSRHFRVNRLSDRVCHPQYFTLVRNEVLDEENYVLYPAKSDESSSSYSYLESLPLHDQNNLRTWGGVDGKKYRCTGRIDFNSLLEYSKDISVSKIQAYLYVFLLDLGKTEDMLSELNCTKMKLAGIKAAISRGTYGKELKECYSKIRDGFPSDPKEREIWFDKKEKQMAEDSQKVSQVLEEALEDLVIKDDSSSFALHFNLLLEYIKENNKIPSCTAKYKGKNIGKWCERKRYRYRINKLCPLKAEKLESISIWFWEYKK